MIWTPLPLRLWREVYKSAKSNPCVDLVSSLSVGHVPVSISFPERDDTKCGNKSWEGCNCHIN